MTGWIPQPPGQPRSGPDPLAARGHPYLARSAGIMAEAAGVLGRTEEAGPYAELAKRAAARFRGEYVSPNGGLTFTSQTAYAVALELDLLAPEQRAHAGRLLAQQLLDDGFVLSPSSTASGRSYSAAVPPT